LKQTALPELAVGKCTSTRKQYLRDEMNKNIQVGTPVSFDSENGPCRGTVADLQSGIASVYVKGTMSERTWAIPVVELKPASAA
jgi:hypothetical protein